MEEICTDISATLCDAGIGGYKIFYEEELTERLPENMRNRETLEAALKNLSGGGYIDVKYARGNVFCIACIKRYEAVKTEEKPATYVSETVSAKSAISKKVYVSLSLCAFLGSAAGGCVAAVLGAVL